jgi:hypothetical protein
MNIADYVAKDPVSVPQGWNPDLTKKSPILPDCFLYTVKDKCTVCGFLKLSLVFPLFS